MGRLWQRIERGPERGNQFMLFTAFNDLPTKYTIAFETFGVGGGTSTQSLNTGILYSGSLSFPFAGFVGTANLADVDKIVLTIEGGRSTDATLHALSVIPEPSSAGLALLGVVAVGLSRRRRA